MSSNPIKYKKDGRPYLIINEEEIIDHPVVSCLVRLEIIEKNIIPALKKEFDDANSYKSAIIADIPQFGACITCKNWKSKIIRKKLHWYCQKTEGTEKEFDYCDMNDRWEWRGPQGNL